MNKLIITAHPNPHGFTHKIAERFVKVSEEKGHECYVMNLYCDEWKQDYLMLGEDNKPLADPKKAAVQEKIKWADELVFIFPLRRFDAPAVLKNWLDVNMTTKFAYIYRPGNLLPQRLLLGKTARVIFTAGAPGRVLWTGGLMLLFTWFFTRMFYTGLSLLSWTPFGKVPVRRSLEEREKMLAKVRRIASK